MSRRDAMVISPNLGRQLEPTAAVTARQERRMAGQKRSGILRKLRLAKQAKKVRRRKRHKKALKRTTRLATRGAGGLMRRAGARALGTPIGAAVGALLVAGVALLRLASGQPLEGTGEMVNRMVLGDMDDEARARTTTRNQLQGDSEITRIVAKTGSDNAQVQSIGKDLFDMHKRSEIGASLMREEFPANNIIDMLILRGRDAFMKAWNGNDGPGRIEEARRKYGEIVNSTENCGGR